MVRAPTCVEAAPGLSGAGWRFDRPAKKETTQLLPNKGEELRQHRQQTCLAAWTLQLPEVQRRDASRQQ